jgi:hypothetical protein
MRTLAALHIAEEAFLESSLEGDELKKKLMQFFDDGDSYEGCTPAEMAEAAFEHILQCRIERLLEDE